ncbi:MAG TPA: anthrone oxygenase family protein [Vicinamibacterales bacterium]|nr:anthrone oxygenase family protein [Vicinamibacterales bacterium]
MNILDFVTLLAAIGAALIAGSFFAFSTFVMRALEALPPPHGIAAMQSINVVVINPWFMTAFLGTAVLCAGVGAAALARWHDPGAGYLLAGAVLYVAGTFLVTMVFNVPRNDALAQVSPTSAEAARLWAAYLSAWTAWNHVRTVAALGAMVSLTIAFRVRG